MDPTVIARVTQIMRDHPGTPLETALQYAMSVPQPDMLAGDGSSDLLAQRNRLAQIKGDQAGPVPVTGADEVQPDYPALQDKQQLGELLAQRDRLAQIKNPPQAPTDLDAQIQQRAAEADKRYANRFTNMDASIQQRANDADQKQRRMAYYHQLMAKQYSGKQITDTERTYLQQVHSAQGTK